MDRKLVRFKASWCGPCKISKPVAEKIARNFDLELDEFETEENVELSQSYNVKVVPTLILVEGGAEIARITGANTYNKTVEALGLKATPASVA